MGNLHRALANPKDNTDEIIKLQKLLEERDRNLLLLQEKERRSSGKLAALNEEKTRLKNDVMYMQKELGELQQKDQYYSRIRTQILAIIAERDALMEHRQKSDHQLKKMQVDELRQRQVNQNLKEECHQLMEDNWNLAAKGEAAMGLELEARMEVKRLSRDSKTLNYKLSKLRDVARELEKLREQYVHLERIMQFVKMNSEQLAERLKTEKDSHRKELQDLQAKTGREKGEEAPSANCSKCREKLNDIRNAEIQIMKLQKTTKRQAKMLKEHQRNVYKAKHLTTDVREQLDMSMKQDSFITGLRGNVQQFKEYIKQQEKAAPKTDHEKTPTPYENSESHQRVGGSTEVPSTSTGLTHAHIEQIERRCRDQKANCSSHMGEAEDKYQCLLRSYYEVRDELEQRLNEVDILKKTVMEERGKTANTPNSIFIRFLNNTV